MPQTYVVHLGNSKDLMEAAEDSVAKRVLREHVRESLGVRNEDLLFAIINSVSRGKGQDLFLRSFYESLQIIQEQRLQVPSIHAVIVGSDMNAQTKFEKQLRDLVKENKMQDRVHFVNKTLNVIPYLAAVDVLVQNSQARGECFGRITIEAMAFQLPVLVLPARGEEAVDMALKADLVILYTAVAGKWIDSVLKDNTPHVLPKILWWIHEMRGHYFTLEYVKHLPNVAG